MRALIFFIFLCVCGQVSATKEVYDIQRSLENSGFSPGPVDGIWGRKTRLALNDFQDANGLPLSGEVDKRTASLLGINVFTTKSLSNRLLEKIRYQTSNDKPFGEFFRVNGNDCAIFGNYDGVRLEVLRFNKIRPSDIFFEVTDNFLSVTLESKGGGVIGTWDVINPDEPRNNAYQRQDRAVIIFWERSVDYVSRFTEIAKNLSYLCHEYK